MTQEIVLYFRNLEGDTVFSILLTDEIDLENKSISEIKALLSTNMAMPDNFKIFRVNKKLYAEGYNETNTRFKS